MLRTNSGGDRTIAGQPAERDIRSYRIYAMAGRVDESPFHNSKDSRGRGSPPVETCLRRTCCMPAVALRLGFTRQDGHDIEPWCLGRTIPETIPIRLGRPKLAPSMV